MKYWDCGRSFHRMSLLSQIFRNLQHLIHIFQFSLIKNIYIFTGTLLQYLPSSLVAGEGHKLRDKICAEHTGIAGDAAAAEGQGLPSETFLCQWPGKN